MKFYGVGVKLGGHTSKSKDILDECIKNDVWYMGFDEGEKENYEELIANIHKGDVIYAKSLHQTWKEEMRIKAIGIVTDAPLPNGYNSVSSLSVLWIRKFEPNINLKCLEMSFIEGINRRNTIFQETDPQIIKEVLRLIKAEL